MEKIDKRNNKGTPRRLKYPILNDVEYISITIAGQTVLDLEGKDLPKNLKWRDFQKMIGATVGSRRFGYSMKFNNKAEIFSGNTKGVASKVKEDQSKDSSTLTIFETKFKELEAKFDNATKGGDFSSQQIIESYKISYQGRIDLLNEQLKLKDITINEYKEKVKELENDIKQLDIEIKELESQAGTNQYGQLIGKFLESKMLGKAPAPASLKDSDPSDIPPEILEVLGAVDYSRIEPDLLEKIVDGLRKYVSYFPMKGA